MSGEYVICGKCGGKVSKGQWPAGFCSGDPSQHARPTGTFIRGNAQSFRPIVYFENARGERSYPGRSTDPTPRGYIRKELTTTREVRQFQRVLDTESRIEHEMQSVVVEQQVAAAKKERRERMFNKLNAMGASQAGIDFAKMACKASDERPTPKYNPGSYSHPFEDNASNVRAQSLPLKEQVPAQSAGNR